MKRSFNPRIVHIVSMPGISGVTAVIRFLLLCIKNKGYEPYLIHYDTNDEFCADLSKNGIKVVPIKSFPFFFKTFRPYWIIFQLNKIFCEISPSIIHAHSFDADILSARANSRLHTPLMVTCHSFSYVEWAKKMSNQYYRYDNCFSEFVCVCNLLNKQLSEINPRIADRIRTIYNAPDIRFFDPVTKSERERNRHLLGITADDIVITCVANFHPVKGQEILAEAFVRISNDSKTKLILVGKESHIFQGKSIKQRVTEALGAAKVLDRCRLIEDCNDVRPVLAASDIYVQPSHQEGLSVALGEALAGGLPAIVTNAGGNPEMVADGINGYVVPTAKPEIMADAIKKMSISKSARISMGEKSIHFARTNLHPAVILKSYNDIYNRYA